VKEGTKMKKSILFLLIIAVLLSATLAEPQDCKIRPERFSFIWETEGFVLASGTWVREGPTPYDLWNVLAKTPNNFSQVECNKVSKSCLISTAYVFNGLLTLNNNSFEIKSFSDETIIATLTLNPNIVLIIGRTDRSVTVDSIGVMTKERKRESLKNRYANE
jgi:hypothetical protein